MEIGRELLTSITSGEGHGVVDGGSITTAGRVAKALSAFCDSE
jgi:hypothetical protein